MNEWREWFQPRLDWPGRRAWTLVDASRWLRAGRSALLALVLAPGVVAAAGMEAAAPSEYILDLWETDQGLPENSANAMVQTPDGYLWFGTFNGLVRFNGVNFTVFDPRNTPQLPGAAIVNLHLDRAGRLWVGTNRGIAIRHGDTWSTLGRAEGWTGDHVRTFAESAGALCFTSFDGRVFRAEPGRIVELPAPPGNQGGYFGHVDPAGTIWVGQDGFFGRWDGQRWIASPLAAEVTDRFQGLGPARDGDILAVSGATLLRLRGDRVVRRVPLPAECPALWRIYEDRQGAVWLCTQAHGLWKVPADGAVRRFSMADGMVHAGIRFAFEDREENIWVGANGGGLMRLKPRRFVNHTLGSAREIYAVKAIAEDPAGGIVLGAYGPGLARVDDSGRLERLGEGRQTANVFVLCLQVDRAGRMWVGKYNASLEIRSAAGSVSVGEAETGGMSVSALFEDSRGRMWIGGSRTVSVWSDGVFRPFAGTGGPALGAVHAFAEDPATGDIWAAVSDGLFRHGAGGWTEIKDARGQPILDTGCLRAEADGTLWIGGSRIPLRRLRAGRLAEVGEAQGLPVGCVSAILDDGRGFWWFGSNRGVVRLSRRDLERAADDPAVVLSGQLFNQNDGLASVECAGDHSSTAIRDRRGRLWFATLKGAVVVDPATLRLNRVRAPVVFEEFRVEDQRRRRRRFPPTGMAPIVVPPAQHEIAIRYACLSYTAPDKVRFAYRIDGVDDGWRHIGNQRTLNFSPPSPGAYRLRLKAANNDGIWNEAEAALDFVVQPLYWQTAWFRLAALLAVLLAVALAFRLRLRQWHTRQAALHRTNVELDRRVHERTAELAGRVAEVERLNAELEAFSSSVSHDLRAPLRNITGFLELLARRVDGRLDAESRRFVDTVTAEAKRMGQLIDALLVLAHLGRTELTLQRVPLDALIAEVRQELRPATGERPIEWRVAPLPVVRGDRALLRQVFVNLLANAVKFTRHRAPAVIEIGAEPAADAAGRVTVFVRDNGAGFNPKYAAKLFGVFQRLHNSRDFEGTGIGLVNVKRIVERHGGAVRAEGGVDRGAAFFVSLPSVEAMPPSAPAG